ncbi:Calsyntenin-1 [Hypsibius exemplaris]|uniref:Calsyntenin-1 n=1 Tax=Hypsibius exemplaris TaxID=2072580 RepID=A0A1W0X0F3_HYPEX|nr:Calsyntenin-1 [Hypsibius exemplaris]
MPLLGGHTAMRAVSLAVVTVILGAQWSAARVPQFAIGEEFRAYYSKHHIPLQHEQRDYYHVYVRENTKDLIVEPRIQVVPSAEETSGTGTKSAGQTNSEVDDVCEYKILPVVKVPAAGKKNATVTGTGSDGVMDSAGGGEATRTRSTSTTTTTTTQDEYSDDEEEDDDGDEREEEEALPFTIRPSKEDKHEAVLEAVKKLNCEHKGQYEFDIVAVSCNGEVSKSAKVVVNVEDVNEYEPKFTKSSYQATVEEGQLLSNILQVEAFDEDCSEDYSKIARYELLESAGPTNPFAIDEQGVVRNIRPLNFTENRRFFVTVMAYDAGGKRSLYPASVEITVRPRCTPSWKGMPERVDYVPDSAQVKLYPAARLDLCPNPSASLASVVGAAGLCAGIEKITGHVTLRNDHIGKGCDREDKLPLQVLRKRCSTKIHPHSSLIELLPGKPTSGQVNYPKMDANTTTTHGSNILKFDGTSTAVVLTSEKLNPDMFNRSFTITTWLKRDAPINKTYDHKFPKEHVLCISDDHVKSRHHVALYVRNCRLGLLLRREPRNGDQVTVFRPAEWRWNLEGQLCSGEWHHYAISVNYPDVKLFIDGKEFEDDSATEIIDDWALHPVKGLQTTTVVGACWQGGQKKMDQYLRGYLDGLSILVNETEEESVVQCMQKCAERVTVPEKASSSRAVFSMLDSDENEMLVEGYEPEAFQSLIKQISYENDRMYPTPGARFVDIRTTIQCKSVDGNTSKVAPIELPVITMRVEVAEAMPPTVTLTGPALFTIDGMDNPDPTIFETGVKILDSLTISVMRASSSTGSRDGKEFKMPDYESLVKKFSRDETQLDLCTITLRSAQIHEDVTLVVPETLAKPLSMDVRQTKESPREKQWTIQGTGTTNEIPDFLTILRDVRLKFLHGLQMEHSEIMMSVSLVCVEMFSKIPSAQYTVEIDLKNFEHFELKAPVVKISAQVRRNVQPVVSHLATHVEHVGVERPIIRAHDRERDMDAFYGPRSVFSVPQFHGGPDVGHMTSTGLAITVVVIVCVSFFIFLVFAGVMKIRNIHNRTRRDEDPELQDVHRPKKSRLNMKGLRKLRKSLSGKGKRPASLDLDDDDLEDEDAELKQKQKSDMDWDDSGMSITVNPLEETQVPISDCEYDEDHEEDDDQRDYDDGDMSEEEKENGMMHCQGHIVQDDEDSSNECDQCSMPNRGMDTCLPPHNIRRSQSCVETFTKAKDGGRMTRSELEWDDQI